MQKHAKPPITWLSSLSRQLLRAWEDAESQLLFLAPSARARALVPILVEAPKRLALDGILGGEGHGAVDHHHEIPRLNAKEHREVVSNQHATYCHILEDFICAL